MYREDSPARITGTVLMIINFPEIHIESREIFCVRFEKDEEGINVPASLSELFICFTRVSGCG